MKHLAAAREEVLPSTGKVESLLVASIAGEGEDENLEKNQTSHFSLGAR